MGWLIDRYGEEVRGPIRDRLARLGVARVSDPALDEFDVRLREHGRLSPRRRALVRRRVLAEFVHPLAHAMLTPNVTTSVTTSVTAPNERRC